VLAWFDQFAVEFINSIPKAVVRKSSSSDEKLFEPNRQGTRVDRFWVQVRMLLEGSREGGLFVMIGRKKA
jgi:hypothetical protein